jgi:sn-2 palmitoyl-lipid 9-desaturase
MPTLVLSLTNVLPSYATWERFHPHMFLAYFSIHCGFLLAPFTFSVPGLILFLTLHFVIGCLGVTLCYHRLLAHRSFKTHPWIKYSLTFLAVLAFQRGPIWWVATHRLHHSQVDKELDPHTPVVSFLWSHILWVLFTHPQLDESVETTHRLARDLAEDPGMRFLEKYYTAINVGSLLLIYGAGYWFGGPKLGLSLLVWGGFLRMSVLLNATWFVNSAAHLWGYRNYKTNDTSRNNWWVALITWGEGWHNNHHADQRAARNGHHWYEVDITYYVILLMKQIGWATDVVPVSDRLKKSVEPLEQAA